MSPENHFREGRTAFGVVTSFEHYQEKAMEYLYLAERADQWIKRTVGSREATRGPVAITELENSKPFMDKVNDRARYVAWATMYATIANMNK